MNQPKHEPDLSNEPERSSEESGPLIYQSGELLQGRREVWIKHGDQMYRLRLTSRSSLYLTK